MIVIIQCAARKRGDAGHLVTDAGKPVDVVAHPQAAPADVSRIYARPDDPPDHGVSWRQVLLDYKKLDRAFSGSAHVARRFLPRHCDRNLAVVRFPISRGLTSSID